MNLLKLLQNGEPQLYDAPIKGSTHPGTGKPIKKGDWKFLLIDDNMLRVFKNASGIEFEVVGKNYNHTPKSNTPKESEEGSIKIKVIEPNFEKQNTPKSNTPKESEEGLKSLADIWKMKIKDMASYAKSHKIDDFGKKSEIYDRIKEAKKHL